MNAHRSGLAALLPTFGLRVRWDDLELRLPDDAEAMALADLAADGVHDPEAMPFQKPWTRGTREEIRRGVVTHQWRHRGRASADDWSLALGVFRDGEIVGEQQIGATSFPVARSAGSGSWLGMGHHGRGLGTRMRLMALHLAFEGLGAAEMLSEAFDDNLASNAVSRRLGYVMNGSRIGAREGRPVVENTYRMTRELWEARPDRLRPDITLDGIAPVRELFVLEPEPAEA